MSLFKEKVEKVLLYKVMKIKSSLSINNGTVSKNSSDVFTINASGKSVVLKNMTIRHGNFGINSTAGNISVDNCKIYRNGFDGHNIGHHVNSLSAMQSFRNSHMYNSQMEVVYLYSHQIE